MNETQQILQNKMTYMPAKDSDQPAEMCSLIRLIAKHSVCSQRPKASSCGQERLTLLPFSAGLSKSVRHIRGTFEKYIAWYHNSTMR